VFLKPNHEGIFILNYVQQLRFVHLQYFLLYRCKKTRGTAGAYMKYLGHSTIPAYSLTITINKAINATYRATLIQFFELLLVAKNTAKNDMARKKKSIKPHHTGADSQQLTAQACTTKTKGVIMQWMRHNVELAIPIESAEIFLIWITLIPSFFLCFQLLAATGFFPVPFGQDWSR
jgi:hypothetical protein